MGDSSSSQDTVGDSPPSSAVSKNRELRKSKRDQKSWENVYKGIAHLTEAEKLATIEVKYKELFTEYRATKATLKDYVKRYGVLQKDHQHISNELTKSTLSRTKMECLARELQKQNREIKVSAKTPGSDTDESSDHSVHTIPLRESAASLDLPELSRKRDVGCSTSSDHSVHTIPLRESEASLDLPGLSRKCDVACSTSSLNLCDATIGQGEASSVQDEKKKKNKRARK
ncbi:unnamed protein product [Acanthoscelides obtectus]|uniref:Uncharacterized protein n=1 Tax=Acanthoscelides obtectus TaxID=200917 RepID=A0A9P0L075_ACAOB|nr:unnamed protein product [Acanthoscelides obtectus]CAK1627763.1 Alpha-taxilin [Acanthoscelides obtectus]